MLNLKKKPFVILLLTTALYLPALGWAGWTLDSAKSHLNYLSTKVIVGGAASVTERNKFTRLSGSISHTGKAEIKIDLTSVQTNIPIRDERMQKHVLNTAAKPDAVLSAELADSLLAPGSRIADVAVQLSMNGHSKDMTIPMHISATDSSLKVTPTDIILLDVTEFGMADGIKKLAEIAKLLHIPVTVPVSFELAFNK